MTVVRWEYASVVWTSVSRKVTTADPEWQRLSADVHQQCEQNNWLFYWWHEQTYFIWLPGVAEADTRLSWSTGDAAQKTSHLEILNELGAEGWEAVSYTVRSSAMGPNLGRDTAGFPIQTQTLLKRPIV
jgi:hypothetical protein